MRPSSASLNWRQRIATLRDKLPNWSAAASIRSWSLPFNDALASLPARRTSSDQVLIQGLGVGYVLVGDDFPLRCPARGDYAMLDAAGPPRF